MPVHVLDEANRCLTCKVPQCSKGCPIHTPIPQAVRLLREGKLDEAGALLYENNPLTTICSLVCNHAEQCEGHCVLGRKGTPVHFSTIESYISSTYSQCGTDEPVPSNGMRVAIIGSGPAGLAIAAILAHRGYAITIFEGKEQVGGVLRYGIPAFRLPKDVIDEFVRRHLEPCGVKIRPNTVIGTAITIDDLLADGYQAVFAGTGVWRPRTLKIPGETLGNVHYGINYLASPETFNLGERVAVIGAGNAAMDVARTALRHGVRRLQCFARSEHIAANDHERTYAELEGVEFVLNKVPVRITDEGCVFADSARDADGRVVTVPGTERLYPADSVIISAGQGPQDRLVSTTAHLEANDRGLLVADDEGRTSRPEVFSAGDVVSGARTVVEAVAHAKEVADAMDRYLQGKAGDAGKAEAADEKSA